MARWIPLESNPEVLNSWANKAGLDKLQVQFSDIYGLDKEVLGMVPQPVRAVLLLFPITPIIENKRREEDEKIKSDAVDESVPKPTEVIWIKQTISNACGTIGLLHALTNTGIEFNSDSPLAQFIEACKDKTPSERAQFLESTPLFAEIHEETASTGQSSVPTDLDTDLHFTCFVEAVIGGEPHVVELDGRRAGIMDRGRVRDDLLADVATLVKDLYIKTSGGSIQFSMTSLGPPSSCEHWRALGDHNRTAGRAQDSKKILLAISTRSKLENIV